VPERQPDQVAARHLERHEHDEGVPYGAVLAEAQRLGYAEANPAMDVDGSDAAQKLAILAHLAFGARVDWKDIPRKGIDKLDILDVKYAKEMGYRIKLLAVADLEGDTLELDVSPALVRARSPLAEVHGPFNAIRVEGDAVGPLFFHGQGAGQMPTASAMVADMIDVAVGRATLTFRTLELWSNRKARVTTLPDDDARAKFYLRCMVEDHPGVLAQVTAVLGAGNISIASVLQHEPIDGGGVVPLVIMTHETTEGAIARACAAIDKLPAIRGETVHMWVRD
jgi:homoserine dehydrogenase